MPKVTIRHRAVLLLASALLLLAGCRGVVLLDPKGPIGMEEKRAILITAGLMLIVVVPVVVLTPLFTRRYRASSPRPADAEEPAHLKLLEVLIWAVPGAIVLVLAAFSWNMTHRLDPFRPLESPERPVTVQVIALDWKWLFVYPEQQVASVNEVAFPVGVPVHFDVTSDTVMNSFFIPQLGSQIYAMAGMQTQLNLMADEVGTYSGISANFSGDGFTGMQFAARATTREEFDGWVAAARASPARLDLAEYRRLARPSQNEASRLYSAVEPDLFAGVVGSDMSAR